MFIIILGDEVKHYIANIEYYDIMLRREKQVQIEISEQDCEERIKERMCDAINRDISGVVVKKIVKFYEEEK